ncbi:MAG: hypothetical protein AAFX44_17180 [Pseudomonadota bacterium]
MKLSPYAFRITATAALVLAASAAHASGFKQWSTPSAVENVAGGCPIESPDALTLFTAGGFDGTLDVWTYERSSPRAPFGPRTKVPDPVSLDDAADFCPTPLSDGYLFFVSDRPGDDSCGGADIFATRIVDGVPAEPTRLACAPHGPNTPGRELAPSLTYERDGIYLYYSTNGPAGDQDIYRSKLSWIGSFGPGEPQHQLNTPFNDQQPNLSARGQEIVFSSDRDGTGGQDVFTARRHPFGWSRPKNLSQTRGFPTIDGNETRASLSHDRRRLYYGSGGTIFVAKRVRSRFWWYRY